MMGYVSLLSRQCASLKSVSAFVIFQTSLSRIQWRAEFFGFAEFVTINIDPILFSTMKNCVLLYMSLIRYYEQYISIGQFKKGL